MVYLTAGSKMQEVGIGALESQGSYLGSQALTHGKKQSSWGLRSSCIEDLEDMILGLVQALTDICP